MLDVKKNTFHFDGAASATQRKHAHPSLLHLRMALIAAESESPSRPSHMDANEQRAMQLIEKVKAEYRKNHVIARSIRRDEALPWSHDARDGDTIPTPMRRLLRGAEAPLAMT